MAKKENGRELLRQDNDSLRKQFVDCRNLLEKEREKTQRYEEAIKVAMQSTHDDDTHEFLNRVLQGKENDAPKHRLTMNTDDMVFDTAFEPTPKRTFKL